MYTITSILAFLLSLRQPPLRRQNKILFLMMTLPVCKIKMLMSTWRQKQKRTKDLLNQT